MKYLFIFLPFLSFGQVPYVVTDTADFNYVMSFIKSGEVVKLYGHFDFTGQKVTIPKGVEVTGDENTLVTYNSFYPEKELVPLFNMMDSSRISGFRLYGTSCDITNDSLVQNAIRVQGVGVTIDKMEILCFNKWAVYACRTDGLRITNCYFGYNRHYNYGYGVWLGGCGYVGEMAYVDSNIFESNRHCIASSGHENSFAARDNIFLGQQSDTPLDRHYASEYGGCSILLEDNIFLYKGCQYGFAKPYPGCSQIVINNSFAVDSAKANCGTKTNDSGNKYNQVLPQAQIISSTTAGLAPLTVSFTSPGNAKWVWRFGDGNFRGNESRVHNPVYTFKEGVYNVSLTAYDSSGNPTKPSYQTIQSMGSNNLSLWLKDSYNSPIKGIYRIFLLADDKIIWQKDCAGDNGWIHVLKNVDAKKISVRLKCLKKTSINCSLYIDDVYYRLLQHGDFEDMTVMYPPWNQTFSPNAGVGTGLFMGESRSGIQSFRIRFDGEYKKGTYGELYQIIK